MGKYQLYVDNFHCTLGWPVIITSEEEEAACPALPSHESPEVTKNLSCVLV